MATVLNFRLLPITAKCVKVSSYMAQPSKFDLDTCGKTSSQIQATEALRMNLLMRNILVSFAQILQ